MRRLLPSPHTFTLARLLQEKTNKKAEDSVHLSRGMCLGVEEHIYLIVGGGKAAEVAKSLRDLKKKNQLGKYIEKATEDHY